MLINTIKIVLVNAIIVLALLLAVSLVSFNQADPSWLQTNWHNQIHNLGGVVGAWIAGALFFIFGLIAYVFPIIVIFFCYIIFAQCNRLSNNRYCYVNLFNLTIRITGCTILVATSCSLVALNMRESHYFPSLGGLIGILLGNFIKSYVNVVIANIIMLHFWFLGLNMMLSCSCLTLFKRMRLASLKIWRATRSIITFNGIQSNKINKHKKDDCCCYSKCMNDNMLPVSQHSPLERSAYQCRNNSLLQPCDNVLSKADEMSRYSWINRTLPILLLTKISNQILRCYLKLKLFNNSNNACKKIIGSYRDQRMRVKCINCSFNVQNKNNYILQDSGITKKYIRASNVSEHTGIDNHNQCDSIIKEKLFLNQSRYEAIHTQILMRHTLAMYGIRSPCSNKQLCLKKLRNNKHNSMDKSAKTIHNTHVNMQYFNKSLESANDMTSIAIFASPEHKLAWIEHQNLEKIFKHHSRKNRFNITPDMMDNISLSSFSTTSPLSTKKSSYLHSVHSKSVAGNKINKKNKLSKISPAIKLNCCKQNNRLNINFDLPNNKCNQLDTYSGDNSNKKHQQNSDNVSLLQHSSSNQQTQIRLHALHTSSMNSDHYNQICCKNLPAVDLLDLPAYENNNIDNRELEQMAILVESKLADYRIKTKVVGISPGPVITRFELDLAPGIKAARISNLSRDLARSLSVMTVRVVEVIPGKPYVGIELPNINRKTVYLREIIDCSKFRDTTSPLTISIGKDIGGQPIIADLSQMPHLLVAGTTGSGKSVGVNAMVLSMLYKATPNEVRFIMIDPKMLELSMYEGIPHLLTKVVTDMNDATNALNWCVNEMERRYKLMLTFGVRSIDSYNNLIDKANVVDKPVTDTSHKINSSATNVSLSDKLPYIVVVVDEFADLIISVGKEVEEFIIRLAQKARAAGIHLILATQRPSVDVITGVIKANIPARIAFTTSSKIDSRTILDQNGAESLLGMGDMLYLAPNSSIPIRVHGAFVRDDEVRAVVNSWKAHGKPKYIENITNINTNSIASDIHLNKETLDPLFNQAVAFVVNKRKASVSSIQRQFRIGYSRATRIVDQMELCGVVSSPRQNGNRKILHSFLQL